MAHVLVVDADREAREILKEELGRAGHRVRVATTGAEGLRLASERRPDVILVDASLPQPLLGGSVRSLGSDAGAVPVVAMHPARRDGPGQRAEGGVDGFLEKPFTIDEALRRIAAALERARPAVDLTKPIRFGLLQADREERRVWVAGQEVGLTPLEFRLLVTLHDRRAQVQSRGALLGDVWGISADVVTRTVDTHVKRLRTKLGAAGAYVVTVRRVGYRFVSSPDEPDL